MRSRTSASRIGSRRIVGLGGSSASPLGPGLPAPFSGLGVPSGAGELAVESRGVPAPVSLANWGRLRRLKDWSLPLGVEIFRGMRGVGTGATAAGIDSRVCSRALS